MEVVDYLVGSKAESGFVVSGFGFDADVVLDWARRGIMSVTGTLEMDGDGERWR